MSFRDLKKYNRLTILINSISNFDWLRLIEKTNTSPGCYNKSVPFASIENYNYLLHIERSVYVHNLEDLISEHAITHVNVHKGNTYGDSYEISIDAYMPISNYVDYDDNNVTELEDKINNESSELKFKSQCLKLVIRLDSILNDINKDEMPQINTIFTNIKERLLLISKNTDKVKERDNVKLSSYYLPELENFLNMFTNIVSTTKDKKNMMDLLEAMNLFSGVLSTVLDTINEEDKFTIAVSTEVLKEKISLDGYIAS
jgi:hypothetical protein